MRELKLYTATSSDPKIVEKVKSQNLLPIIVYRGGLRNHPTLGMYSKTALHFPDFAPSQDLYVNLKNGNIDVDTFRKLYAIELSEKEFKDSFIKKIYILTRLSGADGAVILAPASDRFFRDVLRAVLNNSHLVMEEIKELE